MTIWAIVPVKPLRRGKSRLAGVLSSDERAALNHYLLTHTLDMLSAVPEIEHVLVISRDPQALALAREHGARTVQEDGAPQLNLALARATAVVRQYTTRGALILPADLPLLNPGDIRLLVERAAKPPVVVIAPDRRGEGTNALLTCPVGIIQYIFGPNSFQRHCERARQMGVRIEIVELPSFGLDLDLPEDLELVKNELGSWPLG